MKNAPTAFSNESAGNKRDYTCGILPIRVDTVIAEVVALLIEGRDLTGIEAVSEQSTTRLSAHIYYAEKRYSWQVQRRNVAVGTKDGRVVEVIRYWLPAEVREAAFNSGARPWIERVKDARASRRKQAAKCRATAAAKNAARLLMPEADPRQGDLWSAT